MTTAPMNATPARHSCTDRQLSTRATISLTLGICTLLFHWMALIPAAGVAFGIWALRREPESKQWATLGIVLNGVALAGWAVLTALHIAGVAPAAWVPAPQLFG